MSYDHDKSGGPIAPYSWIRDGIAQFSLVRIVCNTHSHTTLIHSDELGTRIHLQITTWITIIWLE
jgi:hypothetical protein